MTDTRVAYLICDVCGARLDADTDDRRSRRATATSTPLCGACGLPVPAALEMPTVSNATGCVVSYEKTAALATIVLRGDLDLAHLAELRGALAEACETSSDIILDLDAVTMIDSAGLGLLVRAHQQAKRHGRTVVLVRPCRFVVAVLHTMRLLRIFPIHPDVRTATAWLADGQPSGQSAMAGVFQTGLTGSQPD